MIKQALYRWFLPRIISRACESRIPRSGKRGEAVNCFVVALDQDDGPFFVATEFEPGKLKGLKWDGNSYADDAEIELNRLENFQLNITHYYGLSEITFDSIVDYAWQFVTGYVYFKIRVYRRLEATFQYLFNKKRLVTKRRMDLLRFMVEDQLERDHDGINLLSLMTKIYSMRLFLHPSWEAQERKVSLYVQSLVESGELRQVNDEFVVTGKAIATLEEHEEIEQRHTEAVKLQRKMFWLTLVAVSFAVIQSGVVKLPTLFDLTISGP